jgi:mono/diheme cytochrome c family protein
MNPRLRRGLVIIGLVLAPFIIALLFTYQLLALPFPTDMADQPVVGYQDSPRLLPPDGAVPIQGLSLVPEEFPANPVPPDEASLQRGAILYNINCQMCHGPQGHGDGPLAKYFEKTPQNLTSAQISAVFDGTVYVMMSQGSGQMPSLAENLTPHERWDVVNYVRTLPAR